MQSLGVLALESKVISALFLAVWSFPWTIRCFCSGWDLSIDVFISEPSLEDVRTLGKKAVFPSHLMVEETNVEWNDVDTGRAGKQRSVSTVLVLKPCCFTVRLSTLLVAFLNSELISSWEPLRLFIYISFTTYQHIDYARYECIFYLQSHSVRILKTEETNSSVCMKILNSNYYSY